MNWRDDKILLWIDVFSKPDSSFRAVEGEEDLKNWHPRNDEEKKAFEALVARENRELLKEWYSRAISVQGPHDLFRRALENAIDEDIPVKTVNPRK